MDRQSWYNTTSGNRYALCVGIGQYTNLPNGNLRYAIADAQAIADVLRHSERGSFQVTLLVLTRRHTDCCVTTRVFKNLEPCTRKGNISSEVEIY